MIPSALAVGSPPTAHEYISDVSPTTIGASVPGEAKRSIITFRFTSSNVFSPAISLLGSPGWQV